MDLIPKEPTDAPSWDLFSGGLPLDPTEKQVVINKIKATRPLDLKLQWLLSEDIKKVDVSSLQHPPKKIMFRPINE